MGQAVKQLIATFTSDLESLIEEEVIAKVRAALGRPERSTAKAPVAKEKKLRLVPEKRSEKQLEALRAKIVAFAVRAPGQRSEDMQKGLKLGPNDIALPLRQLLKNKLLRCEGEARGRRYWVVGANGQAD